MRKAGTFLTHVAAALLFISVAGLWTFHARDKGPEDIRTSDTTGAFYSVVIDAHQIRERQSQPRAVLESILDGWAVTWRSVDIRAKYQAFFDTYLTSVYLSTGNVMDAYKVLVFPLNLIFLTGAYLVFLHVTSKPRVSVWLAVMASMPVFLPLAGEQFGMGPVTLFSRRHLFTAFAPWLVWMYYRFQNSAHGMLVVFAAAGLAANLHASGILLVEILVVTFLIGGTNWWRVRVGAGGLMIACVTGGIAVGGLWGQIDVFLRRLLSSFIPNAYASAGSPKQISEELGYLFYPPHTWSHLPEWLVHAISLGVAVIALAPLLLRKKVTPRMYSHLLFGAAFAVTAFLSFSEFKYWLILSAGLYVIGHRRPPDDIFEVTHLAVIATYIVSFLGTLLFQAAYYWLDDMPLVFNQLRGVRFLGFWAYVWIAVLMRDACWVTASSGLRRLTATALVIATFADVRILVRDHFRAPLEQARTESLMAAARWARDRTDTHAKFMVDSWAFGIVAEREVSIGDKAKSKQDYARAEPSALMNMARAQEIGYVVIEKREHGVLPPGIEAEYENEHFVVAQVGNRNPT